MNESRQLSRSGVLKDKAALADLFDKYGLRAVINPMAEAERIELTAFVVAALRASASEKPAHEGYPGIAHDLETMRAEVTRLQLLINTPELQDFLQGVKVEQAHQVERWGDAHDRSKSAENWYWLVGYLAGKALRSSTSGDRDKALHHTISSAAALFQWHKAIARDTSGAGIGNDQDLQPDEVKR